MNGLQNNKSTKWLNSIIKLYLQRRMHKIQYSMDHPLEIQRSLLNNLIYNAKNTHWGIKHDFDNIHNYEDFCRSVPISVYDDLFPYIDRMMHGESDILWFDNCEWFAKSSGTTSDKSKFIPVTPQMLKNGHTKSNWDVVTFLYDNFSESKIFQNKNLVLGGSLERFEPYPKTRFGDVSAVMLYNMPKLGRPFYAPDFHTALMSNWDEKLEKIANITSKENISMFGGVPSWTLILLRKILEITGKNNMFEVWPNADVYIHGGVNFEPYREQFKDLFPSKDFKYMEIYNASEGYFGIQNDFSKDDMLLLLDNAVYYEFIEMSDYNNGNKKAINLADVEVNTNYAMLISTESGLWRYEIGDTIMFTSVKPYKFKITGRTKHFINVFGEEVMVSNTDKAINMTCRNMKCQIAEYTVAPIFIENNNKGGHEWVVEFENPPVDISAFASLLDKNLQAVNSDYEAKRYKDMALKSLKLNVVPKGHFYKWMEKRNKLGGQNKVPRLCNSRRFVEELLNLE